MTTESDPARPTGNSIEIDAPPARVWEIVSEVRNAPQWSSQATRVYASSGPTTSGTRAFNINKQGPVYWPTTTRVVTFEPERRFHNRTGGHGTIWAFELEPTGSGGTRLTQWSRPPAVLASLISFVVDKVSGPKTGDAEPGTRGPSGSLQRIKALAEQS